MLHYTRVLKLKFSFSQVKSPKFNTYIQVLAYHIKLFLSMTTSYKLPENFLRTISSQEVLFILLIHT
ncbi:hypothetical protein EFA01_19460 [Enterococcus faecalis]|nr:hypothetical protein EfsSVR2330_20140 [Enterococcus faecalis]GEB01633.1 hypothetical protein EFA01_19460 [Enterococcus faecalis]